MAGVSCVGGDVADPEKNINTPRSLALWLEDEVARLERQSASRSVLQSLPNQRLETLGSLTSHSAPLLLQDTAARDLTFPWLGLSSQLPLPKFVLLSDARLPSSEEKSDQTPHMRSLQRLDTGPVSTIDPLKSIPIHVADFLLEVYITRAMPLYPIFHEAWLRSCYWAVIHQPSNAEGEANKPYNVFTISLTMAISLSTAERPKQARANEMALKLFQHAMAHANSVFTNDYAGLQALVLLHVYAVMNPAAANVYFLASYMMQSCIDLGLPYENPSSPSLNLLERDLKRRLFWTAWELDVSCSGSFTRPVTLLPKHITTAFPSDLEDSAIHPTFMDPCGRSSKFLCGRVRTFRQIEVEVTAILFHNEPIDPEFESLEFWMDNVEKRIHAWRNCVHDSVLANQEQSLIAQWQEMAVFADIADPQVIVTLYRPCPRVRNPTTANLLKAFNASVEVARGYTTQAGMGFGNLKYTLQPCHHVFSAAMVFLHAIRECAVALAEIYSLEQMEDFMGTFPAFFALTAERWPASAACKDEYLRLLEPVKEYYVNSLQLNTIEYLPNLGEVEEYLCQPDLWILGSESFAFSSTTSDDPGGLGSDTWANFDLDSNYWDSYFNMESLSG